MDGQAYATQRSSTLEVIVTPSSASQNAAAVYLAGLAPGSRRQPSGCPRERCQRAGLSLARGALLARGAALFNLINKGQPHPRPATKPPGGGPYAAAAGLLHVL